MKIRIFVIIVTFFACVQVTLATGFTSDEELVQQLASSSYAERQTAYKQLAKTRGRFRVQIERGLKSDNPEIRFRCRKLFSLILADETEQRLERFISCGLQPEDAPLLGWSKFRDRAGDSVETRDSFVKLYRFDPEFLKLAKVQPELALQTYRDRLVQFRVKVGNGKSVSELTTLRPEALNLLRQKNVVNVEDLELLKLVAGIARDFDGSFALIEKSFRGQLEKQFQALVLEDGSVDYLQAERLSFLANDVGLQGELADAVRPRFTGAVQRLVGLAEFNRQERIEIGKLIRVARYVDLEEVVPLAVRVGTRRVNAKPKTLKLEAKALYLVGKYGQKKDVAALQKMIENRVPVWGNGRGITIDGVTIETLIGDVALASAIHLSGESLAEYGFLQPVVDSPDFLTTPLYMLGFRSDELRQKAIAKWKAR